MLTSLHLHEKNREVRILYLHLYSLTCICIVLDLSWDISMSQEKLQTMIMQFFYGGGGKRGVLWDLCK